MIAMLLIGSLLAAAAHTAHLLAAAANAAPLCGSERWAVKTLSDPLARYVDLEDIAQTTITELNELPARSWASSLRRHPPEEMTVYEVEGIVRHVKGQADRDVHVVLADPETGDSIIAEVVDPECAGARDSPHVSTLVAARQQFLGLLRLGRPSDPRPLLGRRVRIRGVGFYDFPHGRTGRARNNFELHPVIYIAPVE